MARRFVTASTQCLYHASAVVLTPPFTAACWFRVNDVANEHVLIGFSKSISNFKWCQLVASGGIVGDPVRFRMKDGGATPTATTTTGFTAGKWYHACAVAAAVDDRSVYIDRGSKGTNADAIAVAVDYTAIGVLPTAAPSLYADGDIAEVCFWNDALTDAERVRLFEGDLPTQVRPQNLVCYLDLWDDTDRDVMGQRHFTAVNSPGIAPHPPKVIRPVRRFFSFPTAAPPVATAPGIVGAGVGGAACIIGG